MKKTLKIALFSLLTLIALTLVCSATEYSFTYADDVPVYTNEYDMLCNYDALDVSINENTYFNIQLVQLNDLGYSNIFVYCSNIEVYCSFVDSIPQGSDTEQFSELILDKMSKYNAEAENLNSIWISNGILAELYLYGTNYLNDLQNRYDEGFTDGYDEGFTDGYSDGYTQGTYNGMQETESLKVGLLTILSAPFYVLGGILDFEILGINLFNIITGLLTVCLFAFVVKRLINGGV